MNAARSASAAKSRGRAWPRFAPQWLGACGAAGNCKRAAFCNASARCSPNCAARCGAALDENSMQRHAPFTVVQRTVAGGTLGDRAPARYLRRSRAARATYPALAALP